MLKKVLSQLLLGIDTITGIGAYVILSFIFGEPFNIWFFAFAGFCAYLPDLDFIWFLMRSPEERKWGHWVGYSLHHLLLTVPLVVLITAIGTLWSGVEHTVFLTTLAFVCVVGHFIHDGSKRPMHVLSPITRDGRIDFWAPYDWLQVQLTSTGFRVASQEEIRKLYADMSAASGAGDRRGEVERRTEPVTRIQIVTFCLCAFGLVLLMFVNGF